VSLSDQQIVDSQALVISVFKSLRETLLSGYGNFDHTSKSDHSPVTVYDVEVEETLKSRLAGAFPEIGFTGEETGVSGNTDTYWLVDPIDGTSSFIRGLPFCTNMAALVQDGQVIAAVIYDFVNDVLYTALKGQGALKDGTPIHVKERPAGDHFIYSMTPSSIGPVKESLNELKMRTLLPVGAAGHTYMQLAEGKIDGILNLNKGYGLHDNAPGLFICEEAGVSVLQYDDNAGVYRNQFILGSSIVVDSIEHSGLI